MFCRPVLAPKLRKAKLLTSPGWVYRSVRRRCENADIQNVRTGQTSLSFMPTDEGLRFLSTFKPLADPALKPDAVICQVAISRTRRTDTPVFWNLF